MSKEIKINLDGKDYLVEAGTNLLEFIRSRNTFVPAICYNESMGPIQTCDTCMVEINGDIARACGTSIESSMTVNTYNHHVKTSQKEALDRILENICCIVQFVIIIMAIVKYIIRWISGEYNIKLISIRENHMKRLWPFL